MFHLPAGPPGAFRMKKIYICAWLDILIHFSGPWCISLCTESGWKQQHSNKWFNNFVTQFILYVRSTLGRCLMIWFVNHFFMKTIGLHICYTEQFLCLELINTYSLLGWKWEIYLLWKVQWHRRMKYWFLVRADIRHKKTEGLQTVASWFQIWGAYRLLIKLVNWVYFDLKYSSMCSKVDMAIVKMSFRP